MDNDTDKQRLSLKTDTQIMRASDAVTARMHRHLADHGLTVIQFGVLEALYHLGSMCQRDIGDKILKTSGNMTTVIDSLEKRNLVIRQRDTNDRHYFQVELTPDGRDLIRTVFSKHATIAQSVFSVLEQIARFSFRHYLRSWERLIQPDTILVGLEGETHELQRNSRKTSFH